MSKYTVQIETVGQVTAYFMTCKSCGFKMWGTDKMDAYFVGARHQRERHDG